MSEVRARSSRASGELPDACRAWADHLFMCSMVFKRAHDARHPEQPPYDWMDNLSTNERRMMEAIIKANIWEPS